NGLGRGGGGPDADGSLGLAGDRRHATDGPIERGGVAGDEENGQLREQDQQQQCEQPVLGPAGGDHGVGIIGGGGDGCLYLRHNLPLLYVKRGPIVIESRGGGKSTAVLRPLSNGAEN